MYCQRLTKDEWKGFAYEDMGLDTFDVASEDGINLSSEEQQKKAISFRDAERRRTRIHIAAAFMNGTIDAKNVTIYTDRSEVLDAIVVGTKEDLDAIPAKWDMVMEKWRLGNDYENVYGWMTLKNDAPLVILRADDEKKFERLQSFLDDAIWHLKREQAA